MERLCSNEVWQHKLPPPKHQLMILSCNQPNSTPWEGNRGLGSSFLDPLLSRNTYARDA